MTIGSVPLILVRRDGKLAAFDAACPHRGAHLGYGGVLDGDAVICPFHGRRIILGADARHAYCVRDYVTVERGGSIYVLLDVRHENGFTSFLQDVERTRAFVPGFSVDLLVEPEYVIENVFDADHFKSVHGLTRTPRMQLSRDGDGELVVEAVFETRAANPWQEDDGGAGATSRFRAHVFSPTLVASELGEAGRSHVVITAATPTGERACTVRVSVAVATDERGEVDAAAAEALLWGSKRAFQQDAVVWEHLVPGAATRYAATDGPVVEYRAFCERFRDS